MRKIFFISLALALALSSFAPLTAGAVSTSIQSGDLIKGKSFSTVYYYGANGKRYVFPNSKTYFTWFSDFNSVKEIADDALYAISIGGNVVYKPNSKLIKITTDPKVYWVGNNGALHHVTTESIANTLFGSGWNTKIDDVADAFFTNYTLATPIETSSLPSYSTTTTINKNLGLSSDPDPVSAGDGELTLTATANGDDVDLSWTVTDMESPMGFKVVKNTTGSPVYPGDAYHYLSDPDARSDEWTGLADGTYYFRVCEYLGGSCGVYSNQVAVTITSGSTAGGDGEIALSATSDGDDVHLSWSVSGIDTTDGFKIVKNTSGNPVYPGDAYKYLSEPSTRSYTWTGLAAGTYHFRVCEYLGGSCGTYSNDVAVTVEGVTSGGGEITLNGTIDGTTANLTWTLSSGFESPMGFKIVQNQTGSPVYPGDSYHYESDPDYRSDQWKYMDPGTYYFRVCEYLGGECGVYSNQVTLTIE